VTKILILGATGYLGAELLRQARSAGVEALAAARTLPGAGGHERVWDARESGATERLLRETEPEVVLIAAALARVGDCAADPALAHRLNAELPETVARWTRTSGARLVHVSTDLVFGGCPPAGERYREDDEPSPLHVYGRTKSEGEARVLAADPGALVVRLPLLFGDSCGRGLGASDQLLEAIRRGERPCLFEDEWRTPLEVVTAARALHEAVEKGGAGLLHVAGADRVSRWELGELLLAPRGPASGVRRAKRSDLGLAAERPADVSLDAARARQLLTTPLPGARTVLGSA